MIGKELGEDNLNLMDECQVLHGSILRNGAGSLVEEQPFEPAVTQCEDLK